MKRTPLSVAAMSAIAALGALTACSETSNSASPATVTETVTVTATPGATGATSAPGLPSAPAAPGETSSPNPNTDGAQRNDRGNLVKKVGEKAGVKDKEGGEAVTFTITNIDPDFKCTGRYPRKPQNGRFVALTVEASAGKNLKDVTTSGYLYLDSGSGWSFQDKEGTIANGNAMTGPTLSCIEENDRLTSRIGPASKAKGLLILDMPKTEGLLIFQPSWGYRQQLGWEWEVGSGEGAWTYERDGASKSPLGNA